MIVFFSFFLGGGGGGGLPEINKRHHTMFSNDAVLYLHHRCSMYDNCCKMIGIGIILGLIFYGCTWLETHN